MNTKQQKGKFWLTRLSSHLVTSAGGEDGIFIYLKKGYIWQNDVHQIHEETWQQCATQLENISPCSCEECKEAGERDIDENEGLCADCGEQLRKGEDSVCDECLDKWRKEND